MRQTAALLIVVAALLLSGTHPVASASVANARWHYVLSFPDPASGDIHVELTLDGLDGSATEVTFPTPVHREPVTNIVCGSESGRCYCPSDARRGDARGDEDGWDRARCFARSADAPQPQTTDVVVIRIDGKESFSYEVKVDRPAFRAGEKLSHAGSDFALFKAESVALAYTYRYYQGTTFVNTTTVELVPPAGWSAAAPWEETAPLNYKLAAGHVLPRGYVAFGKFLAREDKEVDGKRIHYVRLGKPATYDSRLFEYIGKATPYYAAVYGPGVHPDVLIVNAPDPMFRGGLGGSDSFFVHETADIRTVAHEYAHVHQHFGTDERAGTSSIWLNEGDADYHSALSLYAADEWSASEVNDFLRDAARDKTDSQFATSRLTDATYGGGLERFAYHKGAIVLRALDDRFRTSSGGELGVSDLLRRLNEARRDVGSKEAAEPVTNAEALAVAEELLGQDLGEFFADHVLGTKWPAYSSFVPEGQLVVEDLRVVPERPAPGEGILVRATVSNRGTQDALARVVTLSIDEATVDTTTLNLRVGESKALEFPLLALAPGVHEARLLHARASYRSLSPAALSLADADVVPTTLRAGEAGQLLVYIRNEGEMPGTARVEARLGARVLSMTTETIVEANDTHVLSLQVLLAEPGEANVTLTLITPRGNDTLDLRLAVAAARSRADEVPGILGGNGTPAPAWIAMVALATAAVAWRSRAWRR